MNFFTNFKSNISKRAISLLVVFIVIVIVVVGAVFAYKSVQYNKKLLHEKDQNLSTDQLKERTIFIEQLQSKIKDSISNKVPKEQIFVMYSQLGNEQFVIGKYDDAVSSINEAKKILPDNPTVYEDLYKIQFAMGDFNGALKNIKQAVKINPASPDDWVNYIKLEKQQFNLSADARIKLLEEAQKRTNKDPAVMNQYALAFEDKGDLQKAFDILREVVISHQDVPEYVQNLDRINIKLQQSQSNKK